MAEAVLEAVPVAPGVPAAVAAVGVAVARSGTCWPRSVPRPGAVAAPEPAVPVDAAVAVRPDGWIANAPVADSVPGRAHSAAERSVLTLASPDALIVVRGRVVPDELQEHLAAARSPVDSDVLVRSAVPQHSDDPGNSGAERCCWARFHGCSVRFRAPVRSVWLAHSAAVVRSRALVHFHEGCLRIHPAAPHCLALSAPPERLDASARS